MKLLNLGCGGTDLPQPFFNVDFQACSGRQNYRNHDLTKPFPPDFPRDNDGILMSHVLEHFDLQTGVVLLWRARELLKPGGVMRISVPDAGFFHQLRVAGLDTPQWVRDNDNPGYGAQVGYGDYALYYVQHRVCFDFTTLALHLSIAGFPIAEVLRAEPHQSVLNTDVSNALAAADNRPTFSVFVEAVHRPEIITPAMQQFHEYRVRYLATGQE